MKIIALVENSRRSSDEKDCSPLAPRPCFTPSGTEHGLSFWIVTSGHRILFDTGASDLLLKNAAAAGIDLSLADTVILSHGHYDHGGGLPAFLSCISGARILLQRSALDSYYSLHDLTIDSELRIFSGIPKKFPAPEFGHPLRIKTASGLVPDDFRHEQCLIVSCQGKIALFSGCAHSGILNIMQRCREIMNRDPDLVLSGFHLKKNAALTKDDTAEIRGIAKKLMEFDSVFYTCHCTGKREYEIMKETMKDRLHLIRAGEELTT